MTREEFFADLNDWGNHRVLLWYALEATKTNGNPVIELGCGDGSTPFLHKYCMDANRELYSFETGQDYLNKFLHMENSKHHFTRIDNNWKIVKEMILNPSVVLIDHAPGERRIVDVAKFAYIEGIIVCHDTQPPPTAADYRYEMILDDFKYRVDLQVEMNGRDNRTWASAVSNHYDVSNWKGCFPGRSDYYIV